MKNKIFVDGDLLAFPSASVAEERIYVAKDPYGKVVAEFDGAKAYSAWLQEMEIFGTDMQHGFTGDIEDLTRELEIRPKPFKEAQKAFKRTLDQWLSKCPDGDVTVYLAPMSGSTNFRHDVALRKPYKGNRKDSHKPIHLQALRDWAFSLPYTKRATKFETDDIVTGMAHRHGRNGYLVQNEKDGFTCYNCWFLYPDHHNEPVWSDPNTLGYVERNGGKVIGLGRLFLMSQVLTGDVADGYSGLDGVGVSKAVEILSPYNNASVKHLPEVVRMVAQMYRKKYGDSYDYINKFGEPATASWFDFYVESVRLAYMLKNRKDYPHSFIDPAKDIYKEKA